MFKNYKQQISNFVQRILRKIAPKFSIHYVVYTILSIFVAFSIFGIVSGATPNPGHPWAELGDGVFAVTNNQTGVRTYTFPDANATILTTNALVTVAQGGTGAGTFTSNGIIYGNGTSAMGVTAAGITGECLIGNTGSAPSWGACGSLSGSGTTNELAYFSGPGALSSLATATYPSLTEISYVKGVTSGIQSQINAKFTLPSLTSGSVLFSDGSTIAQDNANFFWDDSTNRLGVNVASSPSETLDVGGNVRLSPGSELYIEGTIPARRAVRLYNSGGLSQGMIDIQRDGAVNIRLNASGDSYFVNAAASLGIGDPSPASMLTVGSGDAFQVNSTGAIVAATGLTTTGTIALTSANTTQATTASALVGNFNSLTTGTGAYLASSSLTSGRLIDIQISGTDAGASQTGLNILTSGATSTNAITTYGAQISNTKTNATSGTNVALYLDASGATTANYGLIVNAGNVGIGTNTPTFPLTVTGAGTFTGSVGVGFNQNLYFGTNSGYTSVSGNGSGTADATSFLQFRAGDGERMRIGGDGNVGIGDTTPAAMLTVGSGDLFQVNSSGAIAAATGITSSGTINFSGLTASKVVFTDASKNLTSTGIGASTDFIKGDGSLDSSTYLTSVGTGVANELTYWSGTNTLGSLATVTYPSLTEISYVKGVTSGIQSQINAKFTLPSLTTGSVLFSNGTTIVQDNANFFWDDTNDRLGLGTASPVSKLTLGATHSSFDSVVGTESVSVSSSGATSGLVFAGESRGASGAFAGALIGLYSNDGGAMSSLDRLGGVLFGGSSSGAQPLRSTAGIAAYTSQAWSDGSAYGTSLRFETTANNSTTRSEKMRIEASGNVTIGSTTSTSLFNVGSAAQFQVTSGGAITAATGITSSGTLTLSTTPTTSAGSYDLITRNTGTGVFEKIASNTLPIFASAITGTPSASTFLRGDGSWSAVSGGLSDLDYGDITVSGTGTVMTIDANTVTDGKLRQSAGVSVIGRETNTTGDVADIVGTGNQVLRLNGGGTALAFGAINIASSSAVSGLLSPTNGGTGVNNSAGKIITLGGALTTSGAFNTTFTSTGTTNVTLPTSGTLYGTATGSFTSADLAGSLTDETGSGLAVFSTSPTFTTDITTPLIIGGTTTTSPLTLRSTSGVGTTGANIIFQTGNNGATEAMRILNSGNVGIGLSPAEKLDVGGNVRLSKGSELYVEGANSSRRVVRLYNGNSDQGRIDIQRNGVAVIVLNANGNSYFRNEAANLGIGDVTPDSAFTVGSTSQFQVDSTGAIIAATGITSSGSITFSGLSTNGFVTTSGGTGALSVTTLGSGISTWLSTPSSANLASALTDETGSGLAVFSTSPTFTTDITTPLVIGGTTTTSPLTLRSTSGVGTTGADIIFQTGNNGATEAMRILNSGNVGIGDTSPASLFTVGSGDLFQVDGSGNTSLFAGADLRFVETGGGTDFAALQAPAAVTASYTWTLPAADASGCLQSNGSGTLSVASCGGAVALSSLSAAGATNTINNADYTQEWQWNTLAGATGLKLSSTSTAAASNAQKIFEVAQSGANATSTQTTYGGYFTNVKTGTSSTNVALYASATGGTDNYALLVPDMGGRVGIGTIAPRGILDVTNGASSGNIYLEALDNVYIGDFSGNGSSVYLAVNGDSPSNGFIFNNGNVGIGDASPASLFTVGNGDLFQIDSSGNTSTLGSITIQNTANNVIPTADSMVVNLTGGTTGIVTDGVDGLSIAMEVGNGTTNTNSGLNITLIPVNTPSGDETFNGLNIANITGTAATENALVIGSGWDSDIRFIDATPQMTLADNGTLVLSDGSSTTNDIFQVGTAISRGNALVYGDLIVKGGTIARSLTGVIDTFIYDTSVDVDAGEWRNSLEMMQRSWATEAKDDGAGDACSISTDDRCGSSAFPRKAIIATTADGLYIFDSADNSLWMKFTQAGTYALGADTNNNPSGVTAQNGVIYVGTNGASATGLYAFDFKQDVLYRYNTTNRTQADINIGNRNSTATYAANAETGFAIINNTVNDVSVNVQTGSMEGRAGTLIAPVDSQGGPMLGVTIIAAATDSGVSVINMGARKVINYSDATNDDYNQVYMTKRGRMYATNETRAQLEEWRGVDTVITTQANGTPTRWYDETLAGNTPITLEGAVPTISTSPSALAVIERGSAAREAAAAGQIDSGDIVFVGTNQGLAEVHTSGGALANASWSKITTKDSATPYMNGGVRSAYLFDDAVGATSTNSAVGNTGTTRNPLDQAGATAPTFGGNGIRGGSVNFNNNSYLCSDANADGTCDSDTDNNVAATSFTVSLWFKHSTTAAADVLFERCYTPATPTAAACIYAGMTTTGTITAGIDDDGTWTTVGTLSMDDGLTSSGTWNDGQWHHFLLTNTDTDLCMYIDGRLAAACDTALAATATLDAAQVLTIGGRCTGANCATGDSFWDGEIDEFTWSAGATTSSGTVSASANRRFLDGRTHLIRPQTSVENADIFSGTTIGSTTATYVPNSFTSLVVEITGGTGAGQTRNIISNDATAFTVAPAWSVTPDATSDYRVSPSKLYGSTNNVTSIAVDAPTQINKTRSLYVGTDDGADGGGISTFTNAGAGGIKTEVHSSDSGIEEDDFGTTWSGTGSDDIKSIAIYTDTILFATGTGIRVERKDVSIKQLQADTLLALEDVRMSLVASGLFGATQDVLGLGQGADLAEYYYSNETLEAGDVVSIEPSQEAGIGKSSRRYQKNLLGVISTRPGLILGPVAENAYAVALSGRVPVKVTTENGPIKVGDLLTSSSREGYAMRATSAGAVIGRVLNEPYGMTSCDAPLPALENVALPEGPWVGGERVEGEAQGEQVQSSTGIQCGYVMLFVGLGESLGQNVEILAQEYGSIEDGHVSVDGLTAELGTQWSIMSFLRATRDDKETNALPLESFFTDRIAAGFEILTPTLIADTVVTSQLTGGIDGSLALVLNNGIFSVKKNSEDAAVMTIDALGNAVFNGKITAQEIEATKIAGFDALIERITALETLLGANAFDALTSVTTANFKATGESTFEGKAQFSGLSFFANSTTFDGSVVFGAQTEFTIPPIFNKDTAGFALIKEEDRRVRVVFDEPYVTTPVITTNITFEVTDNMDDATAEAFFFEDVRHLVVEKDQTGFTIFLNKKAPRDIRFSWVALGVKDPKIVESLVEGLDIEIPTEAPLEQVPQEDDVPSPENPSTELVPEIVTEEIIIEEVTSPDEPAPIIEESTPVPSPKVTVEAPLIIEENTDNTTVSEY